MLLISLFSFAQTNTWDGSSDANWNTADNWSLNRVPRSTDNVAIPNITPQPLISTAAAVCNNLTIESGGTLTVGRQNLTVSGTTIISGTITFNSTAGTEIFTGLVTINNFGFWNNTANEAINFRGGINNNGTFNAGTGIQSFSNNNQSLVGDFIIPNVTVTGNAVVLTNDNNLTVSTALGGTGRLTNAATAILNIGGNSGIATLTATAPGNTVNYNGGNQDVKGTAYSNLTTSGSGDKIMTAAVTVNNNLLVGTGTWLIDNDKQITGNTNGTLTVQNGGVLQLGGKDDRIRVAATVFPTLYPNPKIDLQTGSEIRYNYNGVNGGSQTISTVPTYYFLHCQYPGTKMPTSGVLTINGNFDTASPLDLSTTDPTINLKGDFNLLTVPAKVSLTANLFSIGGNFNNALLSGGSLVSGNGTINFNGTGAQSITGGSPIATPFYNLIVNKPSGTLSLTNSNQTVASNLTVTAGIVDLSTFTLNRASSGGILTVSNGANLRIGGTNNYPSNFSTNTFGPTSTVEYYANGNQTLSPRAYGNLIFSGNGIKSTSNTTSVAGNLYISNGVKANVAAGTNINAGSLTLGVYKKISGIWGSTSALNANFKDDNYFAATNGTVTVSTDTRPTAVFSNLTASQTICFGTPTTTLSGTVSGGGVYPLINETVAVTINGITQNATINGNAGAFTVNFNTATLPSTVTPYTITYAFANTPNVNFKAVTNTSTILTVKPLPATVAVTGNGQICSGLDAVFTITGTPGAIVTYIINGGTNTTITLPNTGSAEVEIEAALTNQILNVVSVSNGTCVNNTTSATTVIVGAVSTFSGGKWDKGIPNDNGLSAVIANGNYKTTSGSIRACNCTVNSGATLTINTNSEMVVLNNIDNQGTIIVQSDGNLNQINDDAVNTGTIIVRREHELTNDRLQYNFSSSPVKNQNMKLIFGNDVGNIPFVTVLKESNNTFVNAGVADWVKPARGFAVKEPKLGYTGDTAEYTGPANNGKISAEVTRSATNRGWNLIGNPYPSNLDVKKLYDDNKTVINNEFRFWDNKVNDTYTQFNGSYNGYSYAVYNAAATNEGFGNPAPGNDAGDNTEGGGENGAGTDEGNRVPFRIVNISQAFMVRAITNGNVNYKNAYRSTSNENTTFFGKNAGSQDASFRIKLVTPANIAFTQGIVYFEGGNNAFGIEDSKHPALSSSDSFYSFVDDEKVIINGRSVFSTSDVIQLGTQHFQSGLYKIKAVDQEGIFANGQNIYIKDNMLNVVSNITENAYEFTSTSGVFTNRFEIVYEQDAVLSTTNSNKSNFIVYRDAQDFVFQSSAKKIISYELYDMSGRIIMSQKSNAQEIRFAANTLIDGTYVLKAQLEGGDIISRKIRK